MIMKFNSLSACSSKNKLVRAFFLCSIAYFPESYANAIGETPNHTHIEQIEIDEGKFSTQDIIMIGRDHFAEDFNVLDGHGDSKRPGVNAVGEATGFNRVSGPDSVACVSCHGKPFIGGGGDNVANIFPGFNRPDNIDAPSFEGLNVKNSQSIFGGGPKQLLAQEMNAELASISLKAQKLAARKGNPVTLDLVTKGVSFGRITANPDGSLDTDDVEGVSLDLQIRPFNVVGAELTIRDFVIGAMEQHFGIEAEEKFGVDGDDDGVERELTVGDVTATTLFQAALPIPIQVFPKSRKEKVAVIRGLNTFKEIGCGGCHVPQMHIDNPVFEENAPGSLVATKLDLTRDAFFPRMRRDGVINIFSDLKRHDMGEQLEEPLLQVDRASARHFVTSQLWGVGSTGPWLHDGRATTLTDAILLHGGEAQEVKEEFDALDNQEQAEVIEFLKSLQIVVKDPRLLLPNLP